MTEEFKESLYTIRARVDNDLRDLDNLRLELTCASTLMDIGRKADCISQTIREGLQRLESGHV